MSRSYEDITGGKLADRKGGDPVLEKVRALWASSTDESYPADVRESYRLRAEALMFQHRISLATVGEVGETSLGEPEWRVLELMSLDTEFRDAYYAIAYTVREHCELFGGLLPGASLGKIQYEVVGFPADLNYFEMILTSSLLAFSSRLEPQWDTGVSLDENVYRLRAAGWERGRVARRAWPEQYEGLPADHVNKTLNKRVSAIFEREAAKRDEPTEGLTGRGVNVAQYRASYAQGFTDELWRRLYRMRLSRGEESGAIVLKAVKEKAAEAYYAKYPNRRPRPVDPDACAPYKAPNADCERCKKAKGGYCREHQYLKPTKLKERPWSAAGEARGQAAARAVDLGASGRPKVGQDSGLKAVEG